MTLFHPVALVKNYQKLQVSDGEFKVVNPDGVVVQKGHALEVDPELLELDEMTLTCKVLVLRKQLVLSGLTPVE